MPIKQTGIALLNALIVVAITSIASAKLLHQQQLSIQRSDNLFNRQQAYVYLQGVEVWAAEILIEDNKKGHVDHLQEIWAQQLPITLIAGGSLSGHLEDMQARFNLNSLYLADGTLNESAITQFKQLLQNLDLPTNWVFALLDWIDSDQQVHGPQGAEDDNYLRQNPAYRSADSNYRTPKELYYLADMDRESYQRLAPYICALPQMSLININTTSVFMLQALFPDLNNSQTERLWQSLQKDPLNDLAKLAHHPVFKDKTVPNLSGLSINSQYFMLHSRANIGASIAQLHSLIMRKGSQTRIIQRQQGFAAYH